MRVPEKVLAELEADGLVLAGTGAKPGDERGEGDGKRSIVAPVGEAEDRDGGGARCNPCRERVQGECGGRHPREQPEPEEQGGRCDERLKQPRKRGVPPVHRLQFASLHEERWALQERGLQQKEDARGECVVGGVQALAREAPCPDSGYKERELDEQHNDLIRADSVSVQRDGEAGRTNRGDGGSDGDSGNFGAHNLQRGEEAEPEGRGEREEQRVSAGRALQPWNGGEQRGVDEVVGHLRKQQGDDGKAFRQTKRRLAARDSGDDENDAREDSGEGRRCRDATLHGCGDLLIEKPPGRAEEKGHNAQSEVDASSAVGG